MNLPQRFASLLLCPLILAVSSATAAIVEKKVHYSHGGTDFESTIVYPSHGSPKPGILMVPNWMGPTEASLQKAKVIAGDDYVIMMVDMYGTGVRPQNSSEASQAAGKVRGDRSLMRARAQKALDVFRSQAADINLRKDRIAAIGFCFGGGTVLELGRSGADIDAIVSFHGDLLSPTLQKDAAQTKAKVLVLHGAADPYVPQEDVQAFIDAMQPTEVDWQLVQYSNTVHSFTDPNANSPGQADYDERSADRAFRAMRALFDEIWP